VDDPYGFCESLVRTSDRNRFLAGLFAPADARRHLWALYAFGTEISRIHAAVHNPLAGEIRLQWWRELLAGERPDEASPVAAALTGTIMAFQLPLDPLNGLIDAHTFDLYDEPMAGLRDLDSYAAKTEGTLFGLAAHILIGPTDGSPGNSAPVSDSSQPVVTAELMASAVEPEESPRQPIRVTEKPLSRDQRDNLGAAVADAAVAVVTTRLLRELAGRAQGRDLFVPTKLLERHGVPRADIEAGRDTRAIAALFGELRDHARAAYERFRAAAAAIPQECGPAFLPAVLTPRMLGKLERNAATPFTAVAMPQWQSQWDLWRAARRWPAL
jgi:phytoene synthase